MILFGLGLSLLPAETAEAGPYPRDGQFKKLPLSKDPWFFVDNENWLIKSPDKFVHFMGSYSLTSIAYDLSDDKLFAGLFSIGLGLVKELDDSFREGWSMRDIYMDVGGTLSSLLAPKNTRFLCYYDEKGIMFQASFIIN